MKDLLGTDRYGFERILMQLLIPGLVAVGPFLWFLYVQHEEGDGRLIQFIRGNKELALFFAFIFAVIAGAIIEELALRAEKRIIDPRISRKDPNVEAVWHFYLRTKDDGDHPLAIMTNYHSSVVVRFKFTHCLSIAMVFSTLGVLLLSISNTIELQPWARWAVPLVMLGGALYLYYESIDTAYLLHRNRVQMLQASQEAPMDYYEPPDRDVSGGAERYLLDFDGDGCCRAYRQFRVIGYHKDFRLTKAEVRQERSAEDDAAAKTPDCPHIDVGDVAYYHKTVLGPL